MKTLLYLLPLAYLIAAPAIAYTLWGALAALAAFWIPVILAAGIWADRHFK